ncbi:UNVERIFIED_CONTAM: hypothetical protein Slati_0723200 [Sesamum latifolium]|uniref:Reverse transcriptase domain-containing protein n=1 Tax=Sesamum latifolium TaxID=2727402 RepID=A0AAW2Y5E8_9LAMI
MKEDEYQQRSSKYCNFHQDRGHTTEECIHLKEELDMLVQMGHFGEIARSTKQDTSSYKRRREARSDEYLETLEDLPTPRVGSSTSSKEGIMEGRLSPPVRDIYEKLPITYLLTSQKTTWEKGKLALLRSPLKTKKGSRFHTKTPWLSPLSFPIWR